MAFAGIIYDNGGPDLDVPNALGSDFDAGTDPANQQADDFTLQPGNTTIKDVHWWGIYSSANTPATDNFTIRIFDDETGNPSTSFQTIYAGDPGRVDTGIDFTFSFGKFDVYEYWVKVPAITLAPDTTFWLSVVNDTSDDTDDDWAWVTSAVVGNTHYRTSDANPWSLITGPFGDGTELAFHLTVPEPGTLALLGLGLAGIGFSRKRKLH